MQPLVQRLREFIAHENLNPSSFARKLGYDNPEKIGRLFRGDGNMPSVEIIIDITNKFGNLSTEWLLTGMGEMLKKPSLKQAFYQSAPGTPSKNKYAGDKPPPIVPAKDDIADIKGLFHIIPDDANPSDIKESPVYAIHRVDAPILADADAPYTTTPTPGDLMRSLATQMDAMHERLRTLEQEFLRKNG